MRKIIVISMISLDGVMQAPGGPKEDEEGGFKFGGWTAGFSDDVSNKILSKQIKQTDYLLGRKTFDIWEDYWPKHSDFWPGINNGTKYVFSNTKSKTKWENTKFIKTVADIKDLKSSAGPNLQVWGSSQLIQLLLENKLVDELWLKIYPITLGRGKRLFGAGTIPAAFRIGECITTPSGVINANYKRAGEVKTGTIEI